MDVWSLARAAITIAPLVLLLSCSNSVVDSPVRSRTLRDSATIRLSIDDVGDSVRVSASAGFFRGDSFISSVLEFDSSAVLECDGIVIPPEEFGSSADVTRRTTGEYVWTYRDSDTVITILTPVIARPVLLFPEDGDTLLADNFDVSCIKVPGSRSTCVFAKPDLLFTNCMHYDSSQTLNGEYLGLSLPHWVSGIRTGPGTIQIIQDFKDSTSGGGFRWIVHLNSVRNPRVRVFWK